MPINPDVAIGAELEPISFSWTASDVLLYHLGIGAGRRTGSQTEPATLRYAYEDERLQVLPSFGVVAPTFHMSDPPPLDLPGCDIHLGQVVHGAQEVSVSAPLPRSGSATLTRRVTEVWDKGSAAVIWQEGIARTETGEELWRVRSSIFVKGEGGWGGSRGNSTAVVLPERTPDASLTYPVAPHQALLYRLCGDRNPLHVDPAFAQAAGFPAPILHGLCTWGIVLRELTDALLDGDASRVRGFGGRFTGVVFPGETLAINGWRDGDRIVAQATVGDGRPALSDVVLTLR